MRSPLILNIVNENYDSEDCGAITQVLTGAGYRVQTATAGREALRLAEGNPDLLILDVNLPESAILDICQQISANPSTASIPVLHLLRSEAEDNKGTFPRSLDSLEFEHDGILVRQVGPQELIDTVNTLVQGRHAGVVSLVPTLETRDTTHNLVDRRAPLWQPVFDILTDGICLVDEDDRVVQCNRAMSKILKDSPSGLIGRGYAEVVDEAVGPVRLPACARTRHEQNADADTPAEMPEQQVGARWFRVAASAVMDERGQVTGFVHLLTDVTQSRYVEDLEEVDRAKDRFLAMLAHEMRHPLDAISNAVYLVRDHETNPDVRARSLEVIQRQAQQQALLVDDILNVARMAHGKIELRKDMVDLVQLVRETTEDRRYLLEEAGLALEVRFPTEPLWILGDRSRLGQVLGNLIHNASKFTDPGGAVTVLVEVDPDGLIATVTVRDTGIGLDPQLLPHLFKPFTQGDPSLSHDRSGLGLGLALVKGMVELHGGEVFVSSAGPGLGSDFSFRIPPAQAEDSEPRQPADQAPGESPGGNNHIDSPPSLRVLVLEDSQDAAAILQDLLELFGHTAIVAHAAIPGLQAAALLQPDVVICDLGLPDMDGYAVAAALRKDPVMASRCLIALSGYGEESDRRRSLEVGFDLHLTKPVEPAELKRVLARCRAA